MMPAAVKAIANSQVALGTPAVVIDPLFFIFKGDLLLLFFFYLDIQLVLLLNYE